MQKERIEIQNLRQGGFLYWLCKYLLLFCLGIACILTYALVGCSIRILQSLPPLPNLSAYFDKVPMSNAVYGADGTLLAQFGKEYREFVSLEDVPPFLIQAVLATEDRRFFQHQGVDLLGLGRAILEDIKAGKLVQGGSTITQQIAKAYLFSDKSYTRKLKELVLARRLEANYTKEQILTVYLNLVFLGHVRDRDIDVYGMGAAAHVYFDRDINQLTLPQAAMLAGMIQAPTRYSPMSEHPEEAERRKNQVLQKMVEAGHLSDADFRETKAESVKVAVRRDTYREISPHFVDYVRKWMRQAKLPCSLDDGGYRIETTVVPWLDVLAAENIDHAVRKLDKRQGFRGPEAHLEGQKRDLFLIKMKRQYGSSLQEGELYQGLVDEVSLEKAWVLVGEKRLLLPLKNMKWAAKYSSKDSTNDRSLESVKQALRVGDVIWVKLAATGKVAPFTEYRFHLKQKGNSTETELDAEWVPEGEHATSNRTEDPTLMLEQTPRPQGAIYVTDLQTGHVLAMVGSSDYDRSEFNRVLQSCRQPGSAYKPIYYSLALEQGYGYDSIWHDRRKDEVDAVTGEAWTPKNVDHSYHSFVTLEKALTWSKNPPSLEIFRQVGKEEVKVWARRLGFTTPIHADDALALGASCVRIDEMTRAFSVFANQGFMREPIYIKRVIDRYGRVVFEKSTLDDPELPARSLLAAMKRTVSELKQPTISPRTAWLTANLLRKVVSDGHSKMIRDAGILAAGKTGTSSRTSDVWFVGFTSNWMTTVWVGDDNYQRELGFRDASFTISVPMWTRFMYAATKDMFRRLKDVPGPPPDGVSLTDRGGHVANNSK